MKHNDNLQDFTINCIDTFLKHTDLKSLKLSNDFCAIEIERDKTVASSTSVCGFSLSDDVFDSEEFND